MTRTECQVTYYDQPSDRTMLVKIDTKSVLVKIIQIYMLASRTNDENIRSV